MPRLVSAASAAIALAAAVPLAQQPAAVTREVYVAVAGEQDRPITDLATADFAVRVDDQDVAVTSVEPATAPVSLAIVPDTNLEDLEYARAAIRALAAAFREHNPGARLGVARFKKPTVSFIDPSAGATELTQLTALDQGYPLLPGIVEAAKALGGVETPRRVVMGIVNLSLQPGVLRPGGTDLPLQQVGRALRDAEAALWGLEISPPGAGGQTAPERAMTFLTKLTGGERRRMFTSQSLESTAGILANLILHEYRVTYTLPPKSGLGSLRVGVRRAGARVFAPTWSSPRRSAASTAGSRRPGLLDGPQVGDAPP